MRQFVDIYFYEDKYGGTALSGVDFERTMLQVSAYMERITFGRIPEECPEDVKYAVCEMADTHFQTKSEAKEVKSENNDGFSQTFVTEGKDGQSRDALLERMLYTIARKWLGNTGLLYLGVNR